jgi:hypothetical protein
MFTVLYAIVLHELFSYYQHCMMSMSTKAFPLNCSITLFCQSFLFCYVQCVFEGKTKKKVKGVIWSHAAHVCKVEPASFKAWKGLQSA